MKTYGKNSISLNSLFSDQKIEDITLSPNGISYYKKNQWHGPFNSPETESEQLNRFAHHIAEHASTQLGITQPSVDTHLPLENNVFRAHVIISPMVSQGPQITLRRLEAKHIINLKDYFLPSYSLDYTRFTKAIDEGKSILITGATGTGKTTFLTQLYAFFKKQERIVVLEDSPELSLPNKLSSKLLTRVNRFGLREGVTWDLSHLVYESLRMRPDRIILGECRGPEALAIATALQTGHKGVMTTIHSGSCLEALNRFNNLVKAQAHYFDTQQKIWDVVIHLDLLPQGKRYVKELLWNS